MDYPAVKDGVLHLVDGSKMKRYGTFIDVWPAGAENEYYRSYDMHPTMCFDEHHKNMWRMLDSVLKSYGL